MTDRSAMGRRNQRRGNDVQREYARFNCAIWLVDPETHAVWTRRSTWGRSDNVYFGCPGVGYHVEVKGEKDLRPHAWVRQMLHDAVDQKCWTAFRRPGGLRHRLQEIFYVLVPIPTFTNVRLRSDTHISLFDVVGHTGRTNWLLKQWIPEVEAAFDEGSKEGWIIILELDEDEVRANGWPRLVALTTGRMWAWMLMRAWERRTELDA